MSTENNRALEVEIAGYALLALLTLSSQKPELDHSYEIRKIVKWLNNQRNGQGGFVSTRVFFSTYDIFFVVKLYY